MCIHPAAPRRAVTTRMPVGCRSPRSPRRRWPPQRIGRPRARPRNDDRSDEFLQQSYASEFYDVPASAATAAPPMDATSAIEMRWENMMLKVLLTATRAGDAPRTEPAFEAAPGRLLEDRVYRRPRGRLVYHLGRFRRVEDVPKY